MEFIVVMGADATAEQFEAAAETITSRGGRVLQRFPNRVLICDADSAEVLQGLEGATQVADGQLEAPDELALDEASELAVGAWNVRKSDEFAAEKAARADDGKAWDFHEARPGGDVIPVEDEGAPFAAEVARAPAVAFNTSRYMTGPVAVGVVIVDGPASSTAAFTTAERLNVVAEVQEGCTNLVTLSPAGANLSFIHDVHTVTLTLDPGTVTGETTWRNAAMSSLGYPSGSSGMYQYLHHLRMTQWPAMAVGPDWAYLAFFTKYAASWFAYASLGGPRLVMQYSNDGWGPTQIDRVFAHETGHIFWAPDEYASSACSTGGSYGYLGVPNDNCAVGNPSSIDCLMKANTYSVCQFTQGHFGWRDLDADGMPDPIDVSAGAYMTDVGIPDSGPFYDNGNLWIRNQDDGEANQTHESPKSSIDNFIYAKTRNFGGINAEIVRVNFYLANYTGTQFIFPNDYTNLIKSDDTPYPTVFSLSPGATDIAKVRLRPAQIPPTTWHPCLLVHASSPQEAAVPGGTYVWESNNLAQKNLVIDYVSPSQTLTLPVMLQNTGGEPTFEFKRIRAPRDLKIELQFRDPELKPIIVRPEPLPLPWPIEGPRGREREEVEDIALRFLNQADVAVSLPGRERELLLHLAAGSSVALGPAVELKEDPDGEPATPLERWHRIVLPITSETTRFRLPVRGNFRKLVAISFTAPPDARFGDAYAFELVQRDERGRATGGVVFQLRVAPAKYVLEEMKLRIRALRELGLLTGTDGFGDLADAADGLADAHVAAAAGKAANPAQPREGFSRLLNETTTEDAWGHSVGALAQAASTMGPAPSLAGDIDVLGNLLSHAQERLLVEHET